MATTTKPSHLMTPSFELPKLGPSATNQQRVCIGACAGVLALGVFLTAFGIYYPLMVETITARTVWCSMTLEAAAWVAFKLFNWIRKNAI